MNTNSSLDELGYLKENADSDAYTPNESKMNSLIERRTKNKLRKARQKKNTNCCLTCCCCCCSEKLAKTKCCLFVNILNKKLKNFVDGKFFTRTILFAILINTFCMGIEHHEQVRKFIRIFFGSSQI